LEFIGRKPFSNAKDFIQAQGGMQNLYYTFNAQSVLGDPL